MSKRTKIILGVVALVVIIGAAAFAFVGSQGSGPEIETAEVQSKTLAVTVTASGKVEAGISADVFPPVPGTLDVIYVSDGETVTAGTKIAQMDTESLELQVTQAKAGLSAARAQLANVSATGGSSADVRAAKSAVNAASKQLTAAKSAQSAASSQRNAAKLQWENASDAYDAAKLVYPSNSPTLSVLAATEAQAEAGYRQATAGVSQASAGVSQAQAGLDAARAQLARAQGADPASQRAAAEAGVRQAAAALNVAEDTLDKATFTAPIDGVVIFNAPGAAVGAGAPPTEGSAVSPQAAPFSVVDLGALKFTAEVDEADIDRVKPGMKVIVTLDAFPGEEFISTVTRINPAAQPTATGGTVFEVEVLLEDTGSDILLGMKGDADIEVSSRGSALTIPVEALFSEGGTDYVYVVVDSTLTKTEITVGATTDTEVEVLEGLEEGAVVALSGSTQYTDGMTVRIKQ
ncbi:MAG: efflux RND transporter periplasmic adaptor subunit [Coriobacteriia bacterium]|nr:efflux RND transporter periplasmic adaptor subunit [Coriobacteriia bacterium]